MEFVSKITQGIPLRRFCPVVLYVFVLTILSIHLYHNPSYDMDMVQYMGNAALIRETNVELVHQQVYSAISQWVPKPDRDSLLGLRASASKEQDQSRQERARDPYRFAEFLPLFAIRPLYNQLLSLLGRSWLGLVRSSILISIGSYYSIGLLLFFWSANYTSPMRAFAVALLVMASPPMTALGRDTTSDALSTLVVFSGLYFAFERNLLSLGLGLLLASIYFRTDNITLAGPVILVCWLRGKLGLWTAITLALVALSSVFLINHEAGDYGFAMLYYRNFIGTPLAPAEMTVRFSLNDYFSALRSGITLMFQSFFLPFLLVGCAGFLFSKIRYVLWTTTAYVVLHFAILPNWEERWFGVFYLSAGIAAASSIAYRNLAGREDGIPNKEFAHSFAASTNSR
jgi:hypothetical protein